VPDLSKLKNLYVSPELMAFAARAGVSAIHLAAAIAEPEHFTAHLDVDELAKLRASCTPSPVHKPDLIRLLGIQ
jgi:hypothetical protein